MNSKNLRLLVATAALCTCLAAPMTANAQTTIIRTRSSLRTFATPVVVKNMIVDANADSNAFRAKFERHMKTDFISNIDRTNKAKQAIQKMDQAIEKAELTARKYGGPTLARDEMRDVVMHAQTVDKYFHRTSEPLMMGMSDDWEQLKAKINELASLYDLPTV